MLANHLKQDNHAEYTIRAAGRRDTLASYTDIQYLGDVQKPAPRGIRGGRRHGKRNGSGGFMDFEWDTAKAAANVRKHNVDFETAARVFLDPARLEYDENDVYDETRTNVIGVVDGRMLHTSPTRCEAMSVASSRQEEPSPMKKGATTKFRLDPSKPPSTDWTAFDAMSAKERHAAASADPDAQPASRAKLKRARRVPDVGTLRARLGLTQEQFASRFGLPVGTIRDWEQGAHLPDRAAQVLLRVIASDPDAVVRALEQA